MKIKFSRDEIAYKYTYIWNCGHQNVIIGINDIVRSFKYVVFFGDRRKITSFHNIGSFPGHPFFTKLNI